MTTELKRHQQIENLIRAAAREVEMRRKVYPFRVMNGKITQGTADYEIKCMKEILIILHLVARTGFLDQPETKTRRMMLLNTKPELHNE